MQDEEGIAYAEIDLNRCVEPKQFHDVVGYYNRFDVFDLTINRTRLTPARFYDDAPGTPSMEPTPKPADVAVPEPRR